MTSAPIADRADPNAEVGAGMSVRPLPQVVRALVAATLVAAVLNPQALADWAAFLPFWLGPAREIVVAAADWWLAAMQSLGADQLHATLRAAFSWFQFWEG